MTTLELADRLGLLERQAAELLAGPVDDGLLEQRAGGWRLTLDAERCYGPALRALGPVLDVGGSPGSRRLDEPGLDLEAA